MALGPPEEKMFTREFIFEKATKNTYVYQEEIAGEDGKMVGPIYIQKHALPTKPVRIKVVVEEVLPASEPMAP